MAALSPSQARNELEVIISIGLIQDPSQARQVGGKVVTPEQFQKLMSAAFPDIKTEKPDEQRRLDNIVSLAFSKENIPAMEAIHKYGYDFSARPWYRQEKLTQFISAIASRAKFSTIALTVNFRPVETMAKAVKFGTTFRFNDHQLGIKDECVLDFVCRRYKPKIRRALIQIFKPIFEKDVKEKQDAWLATQKIFNELGILSGDTSRVAVSYLVPEYITTISPPKLVTAATI